MDKKIYYYYCNLDVFNKMVKNDSLLLSDPRKLNDPEEMRFYCNVLLKKIDENLFKDLSYEYFTNEYFNNPPQIFIKSFSENKNNLHMWSTYADYGRGIALGFDLESLCNEHSELEWTKIIYIGNDEIIDDKYKEELQMIKNKDQYVCNILDDILLNSLKYKNSFWSEEHEYRLILRKTNICNEGLVTYFKNDDIMFFAELKNVFKYIKEILIGPNCKVNESEIKLYLDLNTIKTVDMSIEKSNNKMV